MAALIELVDEVIEIASGYPTGYGGRLPLLMDAKEIIRVRAAAISDDPKKRAGAQNMAQAWVDEARGWTSTFSAEKFERLGQLRSELKAA